MAQLANKGVVCGFAESSAPVDCAEVLAERKKSNGCIVPCVYVHVLNDGLFFEIGNMIGSSCSENMFELLHL